MPTPLARRGLAALLAVALAPASLAQTVDRAVPEIGDPGDLVRVTGTGLGAVDGVEFFAFVGGFVGAWTISTTPVTATPDFVFVEVPQFDNFTPPQASPPGQLVGEIRLKQGAAVVGAVPFGYLESTFGAISTVGTGGHELFGFQGRIGFDLGAGAPEVGQGFAPTLIDAQVGASPLLALGFPASEPFLPLFGGDLTLDATAPFVLKLGPPTDGLGGSTLFTTVPPAAAGLDLCWQWVTLDPLTLTAGISDGLRTSFR